MYPLGVNIYRQEQGSNKWRKINAAPVKKFKISPSQNDMQNDSTLDDYIEIAKESDGDELEGFGKFMLLSKGILNTPFAKFLGIEYTDKTTAKQNKYRYKVMEITPIGEKQIGVSNYILSGNYKPVAPPDSIIAEGLNKKVKINWKPNQAKFYAVNIYRRYSISSDYKKINQYPIVISTYRDKDGKKKYPETFFTDDSLQNNNSYIYKIAAIDYFGREGKPSEPVEVIIKDQKAPFPPRHVHANVNNYNIHITWENNPVPDLVGYKVYRSRNTKDSFEPIHKGLLPLGTEAFNDSIVDAGFYYYCIAAVDSSGNEGKSALTFADIPDIKAPSAPTGLQAKADTGKIILSWQPNSEPDLMGYVLYRNVDKDDKKKYVLMNADPIADTVYVDSLPKKAKNMFLYRIAAMDSAFNRSEFSDFSGARMPDVTPPVKPYIKNTLVTDDRYLRVEWIANAELDLKGYDIYRTPARDSTAQKEKLNANLLDPVMKRFTDRWAEPGKQYLYYLQAVDSAGNKSVYSDPFPGKLPIINTSSSETIKRFRAKNKKNYNHLKWSYNDDGGFKGFVIYRQDTSGVLKPLTGLLKEDEYKDQQVEPDNAYKYQIRAYSKNSAVVKSGFVEIEAEKGE
jgi:hypothetical protein